MTNVSVPARRTAGFLRENVRSSRNLLAQTFAIETGDAYSTYLRDPAFDGGFEAALRHAQVCARAIAERHDLESATAEVVDARGMLVYRVTYFAAGEEVTR